jgi:hypothetical protein
VFGSIVNLALKNCAPVGEGVGDKGSGVTVGVRVEVGVAAGGIVVEISVVGGAGLNTSI